MREIIPARFERGMPFSEGLAAVSVGGRFGYVDERGEIVIEPKFDLAGEFLHGLAEIQIGKKSGIINRKGEIVVAPMFGRAVPLTPEVVVAVEGFGSPYEFGKLPSYGELANAGLYHISGYWIRKPDLKRVSLFDKAGRGLLWASNESRLFGLLASNGDWVVAPQYESVGQLYDERAMVRKRVDGVEQSGFVDPTGQIIGQLRSSNVLRQARDNIAPNSDDGNVLATCSNGARAILIDRKVRIIDAGGQPTTSHLFDPPWQYLTCIEPFPVRLNGFWSFVGADGHLLFDPPAFKEQLGFKDGYAAVSDGQKWGVIDTSGRFVLPMTLEKYIGRRGGLFEVVIGGREVWLTAAGEERPEPAIAPAVQNMLDCGHGLRLVEHDGLWGITDDDGATAIAPRYRALDCFREGIAWAAIDSKRQWCALGPAGQSNEFWVAWPGDL